PDWSRSGRATDPAAHLRHPRPSAGAHARLAAAADPRPARGHAARPRVVCSSSCLPPRVLALRAGRRLPVPETPRLTIAASPEACDVQLYWALPGGRTCIPARTGHRMPAGATAMNRLGRRLAVVFVLLLPVVGWPDGAIA